MTAHTRLTAWNEGDTDAIPAGYGPDSLDWQRDLRAVLAEAATQVADMREAAALICDAEDAKWELKIETSPEPPEAKANLMWAHMANEASDCAALIRALPLPTPRPVTLADVLTEGEGRVLREEIAWAADLLPEHYPPSPKRVLLRAILARLGPTSGEG
jgi:hypothetical protein